MGQRLIGMRAALGGVRALALAVLADVPLTDDLVQDREALAGQRLVAGTEDDTEHVVPANPRPESARPPRCWILYRYCPAPQTYGPSREPTPDVTCCHPAA